MRNESRHVIVAIRMCLAVLSVAATLIGRGAGPASGQDSLVRVVSPADLVLQPSDPVTGTVKVDFEYDPRVAYVMLSAGGAPMKLTAPAKSLNLGLCGMGLTDLPDKLLVRYDAFDSGNAKIGGGYLNFKIGPDTTKPSVRIVSPKNGALVGPGEAVEIVVAGEEGKTATTWQTGMRRLTLTDAQDTQSSPQTPYKACDEKRWTSEHHFRYVVPRDAHGGQIISLTAGAEDWAKNIGFAPLDLVVQEGFTGVWTTEGRLATSNSEITFVKYAAFSFTVNPRTGAVQCGTPAQRYCGSARVSFLPGRAKSGEGWCIVKRTPSSSSVFKIVANGISKGKEITYLTIQPTESAPLGYHFDCPGGSSDLPGMVDVPIGSILPEGITIAIPTNAPTTATKSESAGGYVLNHKVELYPPRQNH